jgi:hypothetical protein
MAGFPAAWQHRLLCTRRIFCAASTRSEKIEFTQLGSLPPLDRLQHLWI